VLVDDNEIKVHGICIVKIKMHEGTVKMFGDARHVPKFERNLISIEKLDSRGYACSVEGGDIKVSHDVLVVTKGKLMHNKLYKLIGSAVQGGACNEVCG
jgi:hypothetical protein